MAEAASGAALAGIEGTRGFRMQGRYFTELLRNCNVDLPQAVGETEDGKRQQRN
jgi:hypothetical protein